MSGDIQKKLLILLSHHESLDIRGPQTSVLRESSYGDLYDTSQPSSDACPLSKPAALHRALAAKSSATKPQPSPKSFSILHPTQLPERPGKSQSPTRTSLQPLVQNPIPNLKTIATGSGFRLRALVQASCQSLCGRRSTWAALSASQALQGLNRLSELQQAHPLGKVGVPTSAMLGLLTPTNTLPPSGQKRTVLGRIFNLTTRTAPTFGKQSPFLQGTHRADGLLPCLRFQSVPPPMSSKASHHTVPKALKRLSMFHSDGIARLCARGLKDVTVAQEKDVESSLSEGPEA